MTNSEVEALKPGDVVLFSGVPKTVLRTSGVNGDLSYTMVKLRGENYREVSLESDDSLWFLAHKKKPQMPGFVVGYFLHADGIYRSRPNNSQIYTTMPDARPAELASELRALAKLIDDAL